jgi:uncharacterized membrane protein
MPRACALFVGAAGVLLAGSYTVTPITPPAGMTGVQMFGPNSSGQVAGTGTLGGGTFAFIASPLGSTIIPMPGGYSNAVANCIDDAGQVGGVVSIGAANVGFLGTASGISLIPVPAGLAAAWPLAISPAGVIVGTDGTQNKTFVGTHVIPVPPGWTNAVAWSVNDAGQVAGWVENGAQFQAMTGTASGLTVIPLAPGATTAGADAINAAGIVAGTMNGLGRAFIYTASGVTLLPFPPGGVFSVVNGYRAINDNGAVVGWSDQNAWIWTSAQGSVLLTPQVPSGWTIYNAYGINNNGQILAIGYYGSGPTQWLELTPNVSATPAPSGLTLVLLAAALLGVCWMVRVSIRPA